MMPGTVPAARRTPGDPAKTAPVNVLPAGTQHRVAASTACVGESAFLNLEHASDVSEPVLRHIPVAKPGEGNPGMPLAIATALTVQHVNPASGIPCPVAHPHGGAAARLAQHAQWPEAHSAAHRLRTQPDLTAAWHPLRPTIQRRVEQNAVVRPPTAAHLGHPVFEHGHSGTDQPPKHRLNQSGTEVEAANACHPVQRGH